MDNLLPDRWISATATHNYMMKDPLLDWFRYNQDCVVTHYHDPSIISNDHEFESYILEQGKIFEQKVIKIIIKKFGQERVKQFDSSHSARDPKLARETLEAMKEGYPVIHGGVLHNPSDQTFGIPDLLVRSDWLNKLVCVPVIDTSQEKIPAKNLGSLWHYRVIDIKFTCLMLRADGIHILNSGLFPAYKAQLLIYNQALGLLQGYIPDQTYILGRRWKYTSKGEVFTVNNCLDKLGVIDYSDTDKKYIELTKEALGWIRECQSDTAKRWNIFEYPLEREELYPNMCNFRDYPWHQVKERIASDNKELTSLWMVGVRNRSIALDQGVYQYYDDSCTPHILGIRGQKIAPILNQIIDINRPTSRDLILPKYITNNTQGWHKPDPLEFFIDFETFNGFCTTIKHLPDANTLNMIFMIGVGYGDPEGGEWIYKSFVADRMTLREEARICTAFANFIQDISSRYDVKNPRMFHWASIEENMWMDSVERYDHLDWSSSWIWIDMLKVFKSEPIVTKGCLSFGLKEVASTFKQHGFIQTIWDPTSICKDGSGAMVSAYQAHKLACENEQSMLDTDIMREIINYNETDVKVLYEIVGYLRRYHISSTNKKRKR